MSEHNAVVGVYKSHTEASWPAGWGKPPGAVGAGLWLCVSAGAQLMPRIWPHAVRPVQVPVA
jgi:hypothetical protein